MYPNLLSEPNNFNPNTRGCYKGGEGEAGEEKGIAAPPDGEEGAAGVATGGKETYRQNGKHAHDSTLSNSIMYGKKAKSCRLSRATTE